MLVNTQNVEIYTTTDSNYLQIHKNGCDHIKHHLHENYSEVIENFSNPNNDKVTWTTIRDPYKRFISGITYDILRQFNSLDNLENILSIENLNLIFYKRINNITPFFNAKGNITHTSLQWTYLASHSVNAVVKIEDLNIFLDMHFKKRNNINVTNTPSEYKNTVLNFIENNKEIKNLIMSYLAPDYYYIEQIKYNNLFWVWQNGKIF